MAQPRSSPWCPTKVLIWPHLVVTVKPLCYVCSYSSHQYPVVMVQWKMTQAFSRKLMFSPPKKSPPPSHPTCLWSKAQPNKNRENSALFMGFSMFFPTFLTVEQFFLPRGLWKLQTFRLHRGLWELDRRWAELDKTEGRGLDGWISRSCWCRVEGHLWCMLCMICMMDDVWLMLMMILMMRMRLLQCCMWRYLLWEICSEAFKRNKVFFGGILEFRKHSKRPSENPLLIVFGALNILLVGFCQKQPICSNLQIRVTAVGFGKILALIKLLLFILRAMIWFWFLIGCGMLICGFLENPDFRNKDCGVP